MFQGFRDSVLGFWVLGSRFGVSGRGLRVLVAYKFRSVGVEGLGFQAQCSWFSVQGFWFREWYSICRVSAECKCLGLMFCDLVEGNVREKMFEDGVGLLENLAQNLQRNLRLHTIFTSKSEVMNDLPANTRNYTFC